MTRASTAAAALTVVMSAVVPSFSRAAHAGDPTTLDCLTANESALALRNRFELRATRGQLLVCSSASCPADIRNECIRRMGEVNLAMPTIVFDAKDAAGHDLVDVAVKMDGVPLAPRLEGTALSIDPGQHTFTFEVTGHPILERSLVILEGEKDRRERIAFETIGASPLAGAARGDAGGLIASPEGGKARLGTTKLVSLVLGGVSVSAFGVGIAYGLVAMSRRDAAAASCPAPTCANSADVDRWNRARSAADIATVASLVGAAALAGGVTLWLMSGPHAGPPASAQVSLAPGFVEVFGRW